MSVAHEVAWAAGFFDGEGYVTIQYGYTKSPNGKRYHRHTLRIGINHVAPEPDGTKALVFICHAVSAFLVGLLTL